jgi:hypothetical protein
MRHGITAPCVEQRESLLSNPVVGVRRAVVRRSSGSSSHQITRLMVLRAINSKLVNEINAG